MGSSLPKPCLTRGGQVGASRRPVPDSALGAWVLAARPKTLWAAFAPVAVGAGLASHHGVFALTPAIGALVLAGLIQIATNLANDYYDFVKGADTDDRIGPVRVTQAGILSPPAVRSGMWACLAAAAAVGLGLLTFGGWPMAILLIVSLACAVGYTGGPFPLGYNGLGDLFAFLFFGLVAVGGTFYLQDPSGGWPPFDVFLGGAGVGALATAILVCNNLRDINTDRTAGKRTLAVIFGRPVARVEYVLCLDIALLAPLLGCLVWGWAWPSLLSLLSFALVIHPLRLVLTRDEPQDLGPALGDTARFLALYGTLLALGLAVG